MLARIEVEKGLQKASYAARVEKEEVTSVMDAAWVRALIGDNGRPFFPSSHPDIHLLLSLNVDSFHPLGMKPAGVHYSATGVYMALLSLPTNIRYQRENMFFYTLIPGPVAPHGEQYNPILEPLVEELETLWNGVYYSQTATFPMGRTLRAALGCLVCDLTAGLQVAGLAHHSADVMPCPFCGIRGAEMKHANYSAPPRSRTQLENLAKEWLHLDLEGRQEYFRRHGVRYSVLLRLPYFDIILSKAIDSMHADLLGKASRHVEKLFGMDSEAPDATEVLPPDYSEGDLFDAEVALRDGTPNKLKELERSALVGLCHTRGLRFAGSKSVIAAEIWVRTITRAQFHNALMKISRIANTAPIRKSHTSAKPRCR